jgi:acyl-CoA synthetase (NDP forming)
LLVQQFVDCEREVMMGVTHEPGFGHLIGFGLGGVNVEVLGDVSFRLHPLTLADAEELVREHPVSRLLAAHRNRPAGDMPALIETVMRLSELLAACPSIAEADLNPVKVLDDGDGVCVVDARIRMMRSSETGRFT